MFKYGRARLGKIFWKNLLNKLELSSISATTTSNQINERTLRTLIANKLGLC